MQNHPSWKKNSEIWLRKRRKERIRKQQVNISTKKGPLIDWLIDWQKQSMNDLKIYHWWIHLPYAASRPQIAPDETGETWWPNRRPGPAPRPNRRRPSHCAAASRPGSWYSPQSTATASQFPPWSTPTAERDEPRTPRWRGTPSSAAAPTGWRKWQSSGLRGHRRAPDRWGWRSSRFRRPPLTHPRE